MKSPFDHYDNIDDLFRRELKEYQTPPPKRVWDKINAQLPIKRSPMPLYMATSVFIAALLTVGWWGINSTGNYNKTTAKGVSPVNSEHASALNVTSNNTLTHSENIATQQATNNNSTATVNRIPSPAQKPTNIVSVSTTKLNTNTKTYSSNEPSAPVNLALEQDKQVQTSVEQLQIMPGKPIAGLLEANSDDISYNNIIVENENTIAPVTLNSRKIQGLYAGINGSVNNIWILDQVALHDKNFDYQFTPGFTYGAQVGYNFSDNFGLETGVTINARDGQNYATYVNSIIPVNKSVVLNYTEVPIIAKFKIPQISAFTGMPIVLNINVGASYGYLRSAYTFVEGDKAGSQNQYPNNEINALAGFSYDIYTSHPYSFSFGLMCEYGINTTDNDNQGGSTSSFTPTTAVSRYSNGSDFSKPHNLSIGITLAMNYNFSLFRP